MRILVVDNRDSFTYNLVQGLLVQAGPMGQGATVDVRRSDRTRVSEVRALAPDRILIGPGPGRPEEAGISLALVEELGGQVPILGVCLGHQALALAAGARLERAPRPMHGRTLAVHHDGQGLFAGLPRPLRAMRYNSLTVVRASLPPDWIVSAEDAEGDVLAIRHASLPIAGVQFHPESVLSEAGERFFANVLGEPAWHRATPAIPQA